MICEGTEGSNKEKGKWEKIEGAIDSAAVDNVIPTKFLPHIIRKPSARSRSGRHYVAANDAEIKNHGERIVKFETNEGFNKNIMFQDADVSRCLISADKLNNAGCEVILNLTNPLQRLRGSNTKSRTGHSRNGARNACKEGGFAPRTGAETRSSIYMKRQPSSWTIASRKEDPRRMKEQSKRKPSQYWPSRNRYQGIRIAP